MYKVTVKVEKEVAFLKVNAGVRYWEDAEVNGELDDENNPRMPFANVLNGGAWHPIIDLEKGVIVDWPQGITASVHYKVCDSGIYTLLDADKNEVASIDGYVPDMLSPADNGYGDYIIMDIDENGKIDKFKPSFDEFERNQDD